MGTGERREEMRLKVGLLLAIGLLVVVSSAMATSIKVYDSRGDGEFQFVEPSKSDLRNLNGYGIKVDGKILTSSGKGNSLEIGGVGKGGKEINITFYDSKGSYNPLPAAFSGQVKELALSYGGASIILKGSSKGDSFGVASTAKPSAPVPEPGTFVLLAGTMAVGYGFLRRRVRK
jgi:hypothetical protein